MVKFFTQVEILYSKSICILRDFQAFVLHVELHWEIWNEFPRYETEVVALTYTVQTDLHIQFEGQSEDKSRNVECSRELLRSWTYILFVEGTGSSYLYEWVMVTIAARHCADLYLFMSMLQYWHYSLDSRTPDNVEMCAFILNSENGTEAPVM
jgi:hypothetical protein